MGHKRGGPRGGVMSRRQGRTGVENRAIEILSRPWKPRGGQKEAEGEKRVPEREVEKNRLEFSRSPREIFSLLTAGHFLSGSQLVLFFSRRWDYRGRDESFIVTSGFSSFAPAHKPEKNYTSAFNSKIRSHKTAPSFFYLLLFPLPPALAELYRSFTVNADDQRVVCR